MFVVNYPMTKCFYMYDIQFIDKGDFLDDLLDNNC